jgi:hemolysin III
MAAVHGHIWAIPGFSEPISSWTHLLGAVVAVATIPWLWRRSRGGLHRVGAAVFGVAAALLLSMSGVFHLLDPAGTPREVFLRLDHAAIWLLIAGTFTPMALTAFEGWRRVIGLSIVWGGALAGVVLKTIFFHSFPESLSLLLYLALGWVCGAYGVGVGRRYGWHTARWLIIGGVIYSVGAVLDFARAPTLIPHVFGPHELFHLCVLGGVTAHLMFILQLYERLPPRVCSVDEVRHQAYDAPPAIS